MGMSPPGNVHQSLISQLYLSHKLILFRPRGYESSSAICQIKLRRWFTVSDSGGTYFYRGRCKLHDINFPPVIFIILMYVLGLELFNVQIICLLLFCCCWCRSYHPQWLSDESLIYFKSSESHQRRWPGGFKGSLSLGVSINRGAVVA